MKRKIFGVVLVTALALTAGWNFNQSKNEVDLTKLTMDNIDALANPEYPVIPGFNNYLVTKGWNFEYEPPRLQTICIANQGTQVCA